MARFKTAKNIKVGVIGYGGAFNMGKSHLSEMQRAGMTPTAVAELDPERLRVAEADFPGIATFTSVTEMLAESDVNLVVIITPHNTHAELALQCLKAGRHVVCEKPFAVTTAECDAMIREAKKRKLVLSTYHNRHWDGCILQAVQLIRKGLIGDLVRVEAHMGGYSKPRDWWRTSRSISGGVLYDWGVHLLEYALQLIDADLVEVSGFAKSGVWASATAWKEDCNEDEAQAIARFSNGLWLSLTISHLDSNPKRGMVEFTGTKGSYIMNGGDYELITHKRSGETVRTTGRNPPSEGWKLYQNIADHMTRGDALIITGEWARRPIHIIDLAVKSAVQGKAIKAKYV